MGKKWGRNFVIVLFVHPVFFFFFFSAAITASLIGCHKPSVRKNVDSNVPLLYIRITLFFITRCSSIINIKNFFFSFALYFPAHAIMENSDERTTVYTQTSQYNHVLDGTGKMSTGFVYMLWNQNGWRKKKKKNGSTNQASSKKDRNIAVHLAQPSYSATRSSPHSFDAWQFSFPFSLPSFFLSSIFLIILPHHLTFLFILLGA